MRGPVLEVSLRPILSEASFARRRGPSRRAWLVASACLLSAAQSPAFADEPVVPKAGPKKTSSLSWTRLEGAEPCIGTHDLAQRVEALLHRPAIVSAADADLSIEGRAEKKPAKGFRATIVVAKSSGDILGKRELETDETDCHTLDEPVSLAIALMIDPDALSQPPPGPGPKPPDDKPPPPPTIVVHETTKTVFVPVPAKPTPTKPRFGFEGYVGGLVGLGLTPLGGGLISGLVLIPPKFIPIELNGVLLVSERSTPRTTLPGSTQPLVGKLRFWQILGSAYLCPLAGNKGHFQGALCAGGQAGLVESSGSGFPKNGSALRPLLDGAFRGRMGVWVFPFSLTVGATLSIPIIRDNYDYGAADGTRKTLFDAAPVAGAFDLSIGLKFPEPQK